MNNLFNRLKDTNGSEKKRFLLRFLIYMFGIGILSFGVVLNTKTGLGVSATMSVPYVISTIWHLNLGNVTTTVFIIYVFIQLVLARKELGWVVLLQVPFSWLFGRYTNLFNTYVNFSNDLLYQQMFLLFCAIVLTSLGVVLTVTMNFVPNAADGLIQAVSIRFKKPFGFSKNILDVLSVVIASAIGYVFFGEIIAVGLGTLVSALFIGRCITWINHLFRDQLLQLVVRNKA